MPEEATRPGDTERRSPTGAIAVCLVSLRWDTLHTPTREHLSLTDKRVSMDPNALDAMLSQGETRNVEIKGACAFQGDMQAHLAATIGCMANTPGGGTIVIGAENTTWTVQGLS